jgi:hypothetical protein
MTPSPTSGPGTGAADLERDLPNLVIVGVAKCATTSLHRYLSQHPDVHPADRKELRYFTALRYGEPMASPSSYAKHFHGNRGQRYRMEATPGYYAGGRPVAQAMHDLLPDARVIASFRDPVQRCWSWFRFVRSTARIPRTMTFAGYLGHCERLHREGIDGVRSHQPFWGLGGGCYDRWLEPWLEIFGDRFRAEFFEDVVRDPVLVTQRLCDWLGIDRAVCAHFTYAVENKTVQYRYRRLQKTALWFNRRSERFFTEHPALKKTLRGAYYKLNGDPVQDRMDPALHDWLTEFYAPHNRRFAAMLADAGVVELPDWLTAFRTGDRPAVIPVSS